MEKVQKFASGPILHPEKHGICPRPAGDYLAGDGTVVAKVDQAEKHVDQASSRTNEAGTTSRKSREHGHNANYVDARGGHDYEYQEVKSAVPEQESAARCLKKQLGSNGRRGN